MRIQKYRRGQIQRKLNYRNLLKKYIKHVGYIEGVDYLGEYDRGDEDNDFFNDDEWQEMRKLSEEVFSELKKGKDVYY